MLVRLAQMPSMVAAGCAGTNSESCATVLVPRSVSSSAPLPLGTPPRKMQLRKVMLLPVTRTNPWKSLPVMTAPLVANVWSPLTTVSTVPGTTPVLVRPGLPVRGAGGGTGPFEAGRDADGLGEALAEGPLLAVGPGGSPQNAAGWAAPAHPPDKVSSNAPNRASIHGPTGRGIIIPLAHGGSRGGTPADHTRQARLTLGTQSSAVTTRSAGCRVANPSVPGDARGRLAYNLPALSPRRLESCMRVLVTGHEGYLGSVLVPRFAAAGHEVVGLDTGLFADCTLGPAPEPVPTLRTDLRDVTADQLAEVAPDAVVHLAALCNDPLGNLDPGLTYDVNHLATVRLARAAKAAGVPRFLFSSSCSLYGAGTDDTPLGENAAFAPLTPYGESKIRSEHDLVALAGDDFSPVFLRNATAYGFSPRLRGDLVVNDLVGNALLAGVVGLRSDGMAWRPLVHADDIAGAFLALLEAPREAVHARAFNVGDTAENYLIRDVANLVREVVGGEVTFAEGAGADARNYRVSCDRIAREVPTFRPQWTLRKGIEQLAEAYERHGLTLDALMGERHQRLRRITALRQAGALDATLRWTEAA